MGLIQVVASPQTIDGIDDSAHVTPKYKVNVKEITIRSFIDDIGLQGRLELVPMSFQRTAEEQRAKHWMLRIKVTGSEINPTRPHDAIPVDEKRLKSLHDDLVHIESSDGDEDYEPPHSQTQGSTFDSQSTNFTSDYWSGETQQSERERDQVLDSLKKSLATVINPAYHERLLNGDLLAANRPEELFGALKSLAALVHNQSDTMRRTALPWETRHSIPRSIQRNEYPSLVEFGIPLTDSCATSRILSDIVKLRGNVLKSHRASRRPLVIVPRMTCQV